MTIGVLALQGAFVEHRRMLEALGAETVELRQPSDLDQPLDGVVLPGGESTVQGKLLRDLGMYETLRARIAAGLPVLATCAGLILLAEKLENAPASYFRTLPVTVERNAYGRQLGSFRAVAEFQGIGPFEMTFIRAPAISAAGEGVEVLATVGGKSVAVRYGNQLALAFHPEVGRDDRIHALFLSIVEEARGRASKAS